jgi:predicted ATPase
MALSPSNVAIDDLDQFEAIQLFAERTRAIVPRFTLTPENLGPIAAIRRHLDGIPLAI